MPEHQITVLITKEVFEKRTVSVTALNRIEEESEAIRKVRKQIESEKDYNNVIKLSTFNDKDQGEKNSSKKKINIH